MDRTKRGFHKKAIERGIKVTFESDCHTLYSNKYFEYFNFVSRELKISEKEVKIIEKK